MAVTNADILGWLNANPGASPALINQTMAEAGVSAAQYQSATGAPPPPVAQAVAPQGMLSSPAPSAPAPSAPSVSNADILGWFNANPNASDALIAKTMQEAGVSPVRLAQVTGAPVAEVVNRFQAAIAPVAPSNPAVTNADILGWFNANPNADVALVNQTMQAAGVSPSQVSSALASNPEIAKSYLTQQILGQGTTEKWTGEGKGSPQANAADMANILAGIGITDITQFGQLPDGSFGNKLTGQPVPTTYGERQTGNAFGGTFTGSGNTGYRVEFDASGKPLFYTTGASSSDVPSWVKPALILGGAYLGLGGVEGLLGGAAPATLGVTGSTGAFLGEGVLSGIAASDAALAAATVGSTGLTMAQLAQLDLALGGAGGTAGATTLANSLMTGAAVPTLTNLTGGSGLLTGAAGGITAESVAASLAGGGAASTLGGAAASTLGGATTGALAGGAANALTNAALGSGIGSLLSSGLTLGGGLLQSQTSREAAQRAQAMIDRETAAAKASAAFRPVGMTTRFGTSQFQVDPVTGQLTSAGYTLSPEAKAQQDRFMALSNQGLTQAEAAQQQFAPLQTGAQNLFNLGNQYIAQSPESVAQNYLNQQMALLQPGRELELANLQNRLQQQGRGGLAVAQGGTLGATTPELQALYNARATQEAQLAAQAQQAGQQQVLYGAGLLGQGTAAMGNYYAGQQAAYAPYTAAMGQVQGLETLGQQPFQMGAQLGKEASTAGARVGQLGLQGAGQSVALATGPAATNNPYSQLLGGLGASPTFGTAAGNFFGGLFS